MLKETLNKGISATLAISIILVVAIITGGIISWQCAEARNSQITFPEIKIPERDIVFYSVCSDTSDFWKDSPESERIEGCYKVLESNTPNLRSKGFETLDCKVVRAESENCTKTIGTRLTCQYSCKKEGVDCKTDNECIYGWPSKCVTGCVNVDSPRRMPCPLLKPSPWFSYVRGNMPCECVENKCVEDKVMFCENACLDWMNNSCKEGDFQSAFLAEKCEGKIDCECTRFTEIEGELTEREKPFYCWAVYDGEEYYILHGEKAKEIIELDEGTKIGVEGIVKERDRTALAAGDLTASMVKLIKVSSYWLLEGGFRVK